MVINYIGNNDINFIKVEIENTQLKLNNLLSTSIDNISKSEILALSQYLDNLIVEYIKKERFLDKNK